MPLVEDVEAEMIRVLAQTITLVVVQRSTSESIGLVQAYNINSRDKWCFFRLYLDEHHRSGGYGPEAALAFLHRLFRTSPLRKVYIDAYEPSRGWLGKRINAALVEEGRLRSHTWYHDRYWDIIRFALYQEAWTSLQGVLGDIQDGNGDA